MSARVDRLNGEGRAATAGGSGGGVDFGNPNYSPGLTASSINNSGGGGGAAPFKSFASLSISNSL